MRWCRQEGRLSLILILLVAIYTAGKLLGPHPITDVDTYKVHISRNLYVADNLHYLNDLFYTKFFDSGIKLLGLDSILILGVALLRKNAALRWACFFCLTATLPISIIPIHGSNCLYIPLFGWALLVSIVVVKLIDAISPTVTWPHFEISRKAFRNGLVAVASCGFAYTTLSLWRHIPAFFFETQQPTWIAIQQLDISVPAPAKNQRPHFERSIGFVRGSFDCTTSLE